MFTDQNKHLGSIQIASNRGVNYEIFALSEFDEEFTQGTQLKEGEKIYRVQTQRMKLHDVAPLVKINYGKKRIYFLLEGAEYPWFETRSVTITKLNF